MNARLLALLGLIGIAIVTGCNKDGGSTAAKPKIANTPEEAIAFVAEACKAGDVEAYIAQLGEGERDYQRSKLAAEVAVAAWEAAADEKFGKENPPNNYRPMAESLKNIRTMTVTSKETPKPEVNFLHVTVTFTKKDGSEGEMKMDYVAIREGDAWKLLSMIPNTGTLSPDPKDVGWSNAKAICTAAKLGIEKETAAVKEGKYKTRAEADGALQAVAGLALR